MRLWGDLTCVVGSRNKWQYTITKEWRIRGGLWKGVREGVGSSFPSLQPVPTSPDWLLPRGDNYNVEPIISLQNRSVRHKKRAR